MFFKDESAVVFQVSVTNILRKFALQQVHETSLDRGDCFHAVALIELRYIQSTFSAQELLFLYFFQLYQKLLWLIQEDVQPSRADIVTFIHKNVLGFFFADQGLNNS
jgi:hypothetical protein